MARLLSWMADPTHVADFQQLCGVRLIPDASDAGGSCDERQRHQQHLSAASGEALEHLCAGTSSTPGQRNSSCSHGTPQGGATGDDAARRRTRLRGDSNRSEAVDADAAAVEGNGSKCHRQQHQTLHLQGTGGTTSAESGVSGLVNRRAYPDDDDDDDDTADAAAGGESSEGVCGASSSAPVRAAQRHSQLGAGQGPAGDLSHPLVCPSQTGLPTKVATRVEVRYPVLKWVAKVGATLGNEEFYLTAFPFMLWALDAVLTRQVATMFCLVMYLGQATKDYLRWPRPPSPPVVRLETQHLQEFSMPSTHAMAGTGIPLLLAKLVLERYQLPLLLVVGVAALWWGTTCYSRLYLGVHTILDVVCGVLFALVIFVSFSPLMARYDHYQQTHPLAPLVLMATSLALCTICYPSKDKNSAQGDAVQITSVLVGTGIGAWVNYQLGFSQMADYTVPMAVHLPTFQWLKTSFLQFVVGVLVLLTIKSVVKRLAVHFFSSFFGLDRVNPYHPSVLVAYKYTTYLILGLGIAFLIPILFASLGISRPHYYREVI